MYLIVGLGNPEEEYSNTRHNMGFDVINELSKKCDIKVSKNKYKALYGIGKIDLKDVILVKPQTYMNLSGESIIKFKKFYKISNKNIIVIYDDIDLKLGDIRLKAKGGAGTHNGMKSVVENLNTEDFIRIRIGVGTPAKREDIIKYVIGKISKKEREILDESIKKATDSVFEILENGIDKAMNKFN